MVAEEASDASLEAGLELVRADEGVMVAAMTYRVKYRNTCPDGKPLKVAVRVDEMGVHRKNRGGVFPAGVRCKSLCMEVVEAGFMKEEVNHACVVVEQPSSHQPSKSMSIPCDTGDVAPSCV